MDTLIIEAISGNAWVRDSNGNIRELREGDIVQPGETIITDANASVIVSTPQGMALQLPSGSELSHADIVLRSPEPDEGIRFSEAEKASKAEVQLEEQLEEQRITQLDSAPLSQGSSSAPIISKDGLTFVMLERIELPLPPLAYAYNYERGDEPLYRLNGWEGASERFEPRTSALAVRVELAGANDDGTYSQDEIGNDGTVAAQVTLGEGTQVGDTLIVTDKDGNELLNRPVTQDDLDNGVSVEVPVSPGDTEVSVTATVTDPAGNSSSDSDTKPVANDEPPEDNEAPAVSVELIGSGDDGTYSQDEIGEDGTVTAQITLEDGTQVGDTLVVTDKDGNELVNRPITQDDLDNGVTVEVPVEPGDTEVNVTATVTDPAGNSSSDSDTKPVVNDEPPEDNEAPAVSVELIGSGDDGTYSQDEIGEDGTVTAQITLEDGTQVGDTLVVTDKDGNELLNRPVTQDDLDNGVSVEVPVSPGDTEVSVAATVTDPAGNSSSDSDTKPVANDEPPEDNEAPAVSVELIGSGDDGTYSQDEIGEDGTVTALITLEDGTQVGDTLVVTDKDGNELVNRPITQDDLDNGVTVEVPVEPGDTEVSVAATVTDPAGNSSSDSDTKPVANDEPPEDNEAPAVSVELIGSGDDGTYSQDEIGEDGTVTALITLEDGTQVGDTLVVTDKDGNELVNRPVTQDDLDNGVTVEVPVAEGDTDVSVTATVTDPAGNSSSDDDSKPIEPVDNTSPAVSVELTGSGDDGTYSQDEIGDDGTVTADVTLQDGTEVGDTLVVTDKDGNVLFDGEVTQDDLDNGVTVEVPVEPGDTEVSVTATVTDPTGNTASDDDKKPVDNVPPAVTVELTGSGDDGTYSQDEIGDDGTVTAQVTLQDGTEVGDTLVVTDKDGNELLNRLVTQDDLDNGVSVEVPVSPGDTEVSVAATVTDPAGNSSSDSDTKPVANDEPPEDNEAPAVSVELIGSGDDGTYSQDEIGEDGTVTALITLEDGTEVGDTLVVTDKDGNVLDEREVTQDDLDNGVSVEVPVSPGDTDVSVTATVTDPAGNSSSDDDSKPIEPVDNTSPAVSVELTGSGDDGTYSQDEIGNDGTVTAQVTLEDGTEVGDTLVVTDKDGNVLDEREVTQDDLDNGVSVEVPVSPGDTDVSVTATVTDPAGNSSSDDDSKPIEPIDDVPPAVSVELTGSGDDGTYSQDEIGDDGTVTAQVTLEEGTEVGDTLVVTDKDGNVLFDGEVTQDDLDNGVTVEVPVSPGDTDVSVTATVTDPDGNSSSDDDSKPIEPVDNTSPAVSVELTGSGDDGTYSQDEIGDDGTVTAQVTLEDGTEVGDTLVVTDKDGNVLFDGEVTQDDLDNGVTVEVPVSPGDTDVSVTATVTDPDGNSSSDDDSKPIEPIDDVPPAVSVELTGSGDDGTYSQDEIGEDGTVTALITLEDGTQVGDTLVVTDKDGNVLFDGEVTQDDLDNGVSVEVPVSPGDTDVSVTATVTDPDGNSSSDDDSKPIEPIDDVPPAVSVELTGSGDDGTYSQDEIGDDGTVTAQVTLEDGTEVGDTLVVTDKDGNVLFDGEVTQDDLDNGVSVEVPVSPGDTEVSVTATVTDPAGNSSSDDDSKPIEPIDDVPPAVSVELTGSGDDGTYSQDEIGDDGTVTAQVTLEDGTEVGDTLVVTDKDGNVLFDGEVTQDDLDNGVSVEVPVSPGDTEVSVTATVTDPTGNTASDDDKKPVDNVPPAVTVELTGSGDDGIYSQDEIGDDGTVTAQVTLQDGTEVGDTLVVTDKDGNVLFDGEVTQDDLDNGVSVEVPVSPGDTEVSVTATVTDPDGNSSSDDDSKPIEPIDDVPPAVSVELTGSGDDGTYSQDEIGDDGTVTADVTLEEGTEVGDTLIVTDKDGNELLNRLVTQDDLDNGVSVEVPVSPGDTDVSVTATVTDPAGNTASDDDKKPVDSVPPAVTVELTGSGDDGTYSQDEIGDDGTVTAQVTLQDGTEVGDTLVVTDKNGNELLNRLVTQDDLDNGVSVEVPVSPGDTEVSVTATVTDPAGNTASDDDQKPVDNVPPAVSVELTGSGDDGTYSQDEIGDDGTVTAQVTLQDGTEVGDTLVVTDKNGNVLFDGEVTQDDLDNGVSVEVPVSPGDTEVSVTATVTDPDGNSSSDDDSKPIEPIDDVPPAVSVELTGSGDDGIYSQDEIGDDGTVTAQVTLQDGTEVGDTLVVTDKDGNELLNRLVTQDDLDNGVSVEVPVSPGDTEVSVTATVTDPTGNTASDDDKKPVDNVPPAVTVELTGSGDDGTYSQDEIGDDGTVTADVTLQEGTEVGDTLIVTDKDGNELLNRLVTQDDLDNGVSVEVPVSPGDTEVSVTATVTDPAGNTASDDDKKPVDNVPPAVTVELTGSGDDGTYSQDEIGDDGTVTADVTLQDGTEVGDTLVVTDKNGNILDEREVTQDDLDNGVSVEVPVAEGDTDVSVIATVTDPAGNTASDDDKKPVDNVPPAVTVELTGSGDDGTYSQDEIGDDGTVTAQVTLQDGTEVGDTLIVTDKDGNELLNRLVTQDDLDNGVSVEVPVSPGDTDVSVTATVTDPAGNTASDDDNKPVDNVPPQVTVELTGSGDDGTYSQDEIGDDGTVTADVTLQDGTEVGDTLIVTDKDGNELLNRLVTQDDLDNGVSVEVPVSPGDTEVSVTATVTDPAGNSSSDDDQKPVDNVPPQVTVELTGSGDDGTYSQDEIGDDGTVTADVTLEEGTEVGDTLIVTDKDGNELLNRLVTQDDLDNGVSVEVPVAPGDTEVSVTATVTDPAGNTASDDDKKPVDNVPPAVTVELTGSGDDGTYSQDEIGDDGTVTADVTLEEGTEVGDTLIVTDKDGNELLNRLVTQDDLDNGVSVEVPVSPGDTDVSVTATVTDPAGNTASDDDKKPVDNVPPAVTVELTGSGDDGTYSQDEIGDDGTVTADVTLEEGTEVGDTLIVTDKDGNELLNRLVTQDDLDNGVSVEVPVSPGDTDVSVTATVTDPAGNTASDDDKKPVDWDVSVNVPNDHDATTPDGDTSDQVVFESGLADGSAPDADDTRVESSLTLTAPDGLKDMGAVTLAYTDESGNSATLELSKTQVEALGSDPQTLTTQYGELTLNGYSQAADGTITFDYSYELTTAPSENVDALMDSIIVTATDEDGSTDSGDLNIKIVDDAPTAKDDTNAVTEGADTSGNVIGGDGVSPGDVADTEGADGVTVFAVTSDNAPANDATNTDGTLVIEGDYGTLTLNADGSYTYVADPNSTNADVQDVFTYTVRDGDGDESTATLTIDVADVTGSPTDTTGSVNEAGLADGTEPSADSEIITGASLDLQTGWTVESQQSGSTSLGSWMVNTDGTFDYTLNSDADHSGTPPTDSFEYTAVDQYGNTVTNTVTIDIVDDQPVISVNNAQLGSVEVDESDFSSGEVSDEDLGFIDGVFTIDHGADGEDSTTYRLQVTDGVASGVTDTATGEAVHLFMDGDYVVGRVGNDPAGDIAFRITLDGDSGAVTLTQTRPLEHPDSTDHDDIITLNDGALQLVATAVDGDGDSVDSDAVDVGGQFTFRDDGPAITTPPSSASVNEANLALGSNPDVPATSVSDTFAVDFGTDGAGDVQFSEGDADSTVSVLEAAGLASNGQALEYVVSNDGHTLTGYRGADRSESGKVFTVDITNPTAATPGYEFTLHRPLDHDGGAETLDINLQHLTVIDGDNDTVETDFTITVVDDDPSVEPKAITVEEDSDVGSTENTFNTNADATGDNTTIGDGSDGTVAPSHGTATVNADGTITYVPSDNYSGEDTFTYTTTTDNETKTFTVNVTVNPVSDAPDLQGGNVQINEDTAVALGLEAPSPVDTDDQNGSGNAGDNPELLGAITLTTDADAPAGTVLTKDDGTELELNGDGNYTIVIVETSGDTDVDTDLHLSSGLPTTDVNYLTQDEYEAIKAKPADNRHENFDVTVSVTSYEVDDSGAQLSGVDGAESTAQVEVGVQAVTDDVDLTIDGGDTHTASVDEDGALDLGDLLGASFEDLDGSEERWLEIGNVPEGTSVTVNGSTITAGVDKTIVIPASDLGDFGAGTSTQIPSSLTLTPPADFSGEINNITVTLKAQDHDSDAGDNNGEVKEDSVTLNIDTLPVADKPADISAEGPEDSEITFLADLAVSDTDGSETITAITVEGDSVPAGWTILDHEGNEVTADGSGNYAIDVDNYQNYNIRPPAHSSEDASLSLQVTVEDTNGTTTVSDDFNVTADIEVTPVAEEIADDGDPISDSDGDGQPDLTMNGDHTYGTGVDGVEDEWFDLNDGFDLQGPWSNQDADDSEQTFALLTPGLVSGQGDNAEGSSFRYSTDGGTTWVEQTYNGSPIEVSVEYLDTLEFKAPRNQKGEFQIRVEAKTVDTDNEGNTDTAVSGEAILDGIFIDTPVADQVSMSVTSPAEGNEDEPIELDIRPQSSDPNESFTVTLSGAPAGAVITYGPAGSEQTWTSTGESDTFEIEDFDRNAPLTVTPPQDSNEDFTLTASVVTVDEYGGVTDTLDTPVTKPIKVPVNGVADEPDVITDTPIYVEEKLDADSASVTLSDIITANSGEQTGDGSETLTYRITGLDELFDVEGATLIRGEGAERVWVATKPSAVTITTPENFSGQVDFSVTPIVTENDGDTRESDEQQVSFQVTPSPEAGFSIQSSLAEDQLGQLNLSLEPQNGDTNESLSSVWIEVASVTGNQFELYYGSDGSTTLAQAASDGEPGVVEEDGYYKLTDGAWNNIYAQGDEHFSGSAGTLEVQYEITDTPNAGYEGTVGDTTVVKNETHEVIIEAVTDMPTVTITGIENVGSSDAVIDEPAKDVTADGNDHVEVTIDITQPDTDGSESLKYLLIDNVPAGVSVVGGEFVGQVAGGTGSQWRIEIDPDAAFNGADTLTQTVEFTMGDGTQVDAIENHEITITAVTQDNGATSQEERGSDSWTLTGEGDFGDGEDPSEIISWQDANATMTEDTGMALSDLVTAEIGDTPDGRSAVTISNLPPGAVVNGMQQTTIDGELVWYASTEDGSNAGLQALLDGITVTPPANWNDTDGEFSFDTTLTTQAPSGEENSATISVTPPVTPVTDTPTVNVSAGDADSGEDVDFTIDVSSPADNPDVSLVDGQLVISLDENMTSGDGAPGSLWYNGAEITPDGDDNYVIDGVAVGDSVTVSYRPGTNTWGSVSLTAEATTQETGASNVETSTGSSASEVAPPPPEVTASDAVGTEDELVELQDLDVSLPDASQSLDALLLEGVPEGWLVKTGSDAGSATLADNVGGGSWSILNDDGSMPDFVGLVPPRNWSGTLDGEDALMLTARTSRNGESETTSTDLEVDVQAVADGITLSPELSFGDEGDKIPLNLSASMEDLDGSETATIELKGLGEHASFFTDGGATLLNDASVTYDDVNDTYTLSGITPAQINDLYLVQGAMQGTVAIEAWTTDGSEESAHVSDSFEVNIAAVEPTSGDDTLLYSGSPIDALGGEDTIVMRFNEDLEQDDYANFDNIERLDLTESGSNTLDALRPEDVLEMTDDRNTLSILGDENDTVDLGTGWTEGVSGPGGDVTFRVYNADEYISLKVQSGILVE